MIKIALGIIYFVGVVLLIHGLLTAKEEPNHD